MEYTKQHPSNTWETEYELINSQINDNKATLATLLAQAQEAETRKASATTLLDLLEDTRVNQQERIALKKLIAKCTGILEGVSKQQVRVQARLAQWEARAESFPREELAKERKIRKARASTGKLDQQASRAEYVQAFE
jgi:hypothetical protein